jgi:ribosomal protein L2
LPSKKVIFLESQFGNARLNGAFASNKVRKENLLSKASAKFYSNKKPFVKGKAMNVFDRPNGGFKHSSKLLKTFKGRKILK